MSQVVSDPSSNDYYHILGVSRDACDSEIARAYKKVALRWHPDKNPGNRMLAEENFKRITAAYSILCDAEQRKSYDVLLARHGVQREILPSSAAAPWKAANAYRGGRHLNVEVDEIFNLLFCGGKGFHGASKSSAVNAAQCPCNARKLGNVSFAETDEVFNRLFGGREPLSFAAGCDEPSARDQPLGLDSFFAKRPSSQAPAPHAIPNRSSIVVPGASKLLNQKEARGRRTAQIEGGTELWRRAQNLAQLRQA